MCFEQHSVVVHGMTTEEEEISTFICSAATVRRDGMAIAI